MSDAHDACEAVLATTHGRVAQSESADASTVAVALAPSAMYTSYSSMVPVP